MVLFKTVQNPFITIFRTFESVCLYGSLKRLRQTRQIMKICVALQQWNTSEITSFGGLQEC